MHAILSLGATHYALISPNGAQYTPMAVTHRGKALQLLNTAMSRGDDCSKADLDSILATCYALVFQAFYMSDGLVDFTVMVRGCAMVTDRIRERFQRSGIFALRSQEEVTAMVGNWLPTELSLNQENLVASIQALDELVPFLQCNMHYKFYHAIRGAYAALQISPQHAFAALTEVYAVWYTMGNHDFMTFIAQGNHVTWGLFLHYITVEVLMHPFLKKACGPRDCVISFDVVRLHQWADTLYRNLPTPIRRLVKRQAEFIALDRDAMRREMDVSDLV
ncbi:hypothetical protein EYZ11_005100 [Aspergillus tanneri]|nr:hypothetical protein EYZ11_005100 [Aspergillus tanneri]